MESKSFDFFSVAQFGGIFWNNGTTSSEPVDGKFPLDGLTWIGASRIVLRNSPGF